MCGHVGVAGYLGQKDEAFFKEALWADTLRGSHNTGAALVRGQSTAVVKVSGPAQFLLSDKEFDAKATHWCRVMIGHNRHATVGDRTAKNSHPFEFDRIVGAHNGTLDLGAQKRLQDRDKYGTDSEALYANINEFGVDAVIPEMTGAWALVFWDKKEETLTFLRNSQRPFSYTMSEDERTIYWASEHKMLEWLLARNNIKHGTVYVPAPDALLEFKIPDGWNKKIEQTRAVELKGKVYTAPKNPPTFVPTAANGVNEEMPWGDDNWAEIVEGWAPTKSGSKQNEPAKLLSAPAAKPGSKPNNELKNVQPSTRKKLMDKAWDEGYFAGDAGKSLVNCPYRKDGILYGEWKAGFDSAGYDRQSKTATGDRNGVKDETIKCRDYKGFPMSEAEFALVTDNLCAWGDHMIEYTDDVKWFDASTCVCTKCIEQDNEVKQLFERYI